MGNVYRIEPNSACFEEIIADTPEEALVKFAEQMDSNMGAYFKAVPKPEKTAVDEALDIFRRNAAYDENDEAMFRSNNPLFKAKMEELSKEKDSFKDTLEWEVYVIVKTTEILNLCQYGNVSNAEDIEKARHDLMERGLPGRCIVLKEAKDKVKIVVSNIDWDYSGKGNGAKCPLPSEVTLEVEPTSPLLEDIHGEAETLAEHLTTMHECCVCGFSVDVEEVKGNG